MDKYTPNYNLDLYDVDDKPNLNDQYNAAMGKVDTELNKQRGDIVTAETAVNNLSAKVDSFTGDIGGITTDINGMKNDINGMKNDIAAAQRTADNGVKAAGEANAAAAQASGAAKSAQTAADGAASKANANASSIKTLNGKFPVTSSNIAANAIGASQLASNAVITAKIAPGAVTGEKLNASAIAGIFGGLHIHHFDSSNAQADNTGLSVPTGCKLTGFYVEELKLLILNEVGFNNSTQDWPSFVHNTNTGFLLPSYVPTPTRSMVISGCGLMRGLDSEGNMETWGSIGINAARSIGPGSAIAKGKQSWMFGNGILFMTAVGATLSTLDLENVYTGLAAQNEAL